MFKARKYFSPSIRQSFSIQVAKFSLASFNPDSAKLMAQATNFSKKLFSQRAEYNKKKGGISHISDSSLKTAFPGFNSSNEMLVWVVWEVSFAVACFLIGKRTQLSLLTFICWTVKSKTRWKTCINEAKMTLTCDEDVIQEVFCFRESDLCGKYCQCVIHHSNYREWREREPIKIHF